MTANGQRYAKPWCWCLPDRRQVVQAPWRAYCLQLFSSYEKCVIDYWDLQSAICVTNKVLYTALLGTVISCLICYNLFSTNSWINHLDDEAFYSFCTMLKSFQLWLHQDRCIYNTSIQFVLILFDSGNLFQVLWLC